MSKKFLTGENGNKRNSKQQNQNANGSKITNFFRVESHIKSTSRPVFKTVGASLEYDQIQQNDSSKTNEDKLSRKMIEEYEEGQSSNQEKYSVLENSNSACRVDPSDREQERKQIRQQLMAIQDHDTDTESENEEKESVNNEELQRRKNQQMLREAKMKLENVYQLPYYFEQKWKLKEKILQEIADKKHIKKHEFYTQIAELIKLSNEGVSRVNIDALKQFVQNYLKEKSVDFFEKVIPFVAKLALEITQLDDVPILVANKEGMINLTKRQVACFLANMFFCTLTSQRVKNIPYGNSFKPMYAGSLNYNQNDRKIEKLICIYNYFIAVKHVIENRQGEYETQKVTFHRLVYDTKIHQNSNVCLFWKQNETKLTKVSHQPNGSIEDYENTIHTDFANAFIGGGVLDHGLVQEEIRFLISPELIISRLFCPKMEDDEAIMILGSEQYSTYSGYGDTFHCKGLKDESQIKVDEENRKKTAVVAIDAIHYGQSYDLNIQYRMQSIVREILKAYIGFQGGEQITSQEQHLSIENKYKISTGRWGCGIFMGDPQLKFLIQWIAVSQAKREMIFCSFKDKELEDLDVIIDLLNGKSIGEIITMIHKYTDYFSKQKSTRLSLFQYCQIYYEAKQKQLDSKNNNQQ